MHTVKFILIFLILLVSGSIVAMAQHKVVIVPMQGDTASPDDTVLMAIVIPAPEEEPPVESPYLVDAIDKPIVWNQGWDTSIGHNTVIDTSVQISFNGFTTAFGLPAIAWTPNTSISHWGEQTLIDHPNPRIYAKAVLLIDRGTTVEGGAFEWVIDNQNFVIEHNMFRPGTSVAFLINWYNNRPRSGDKVWFFLMSDDERFSSNPVSFIWP